MWRNWIFLKSRRRDGRAVSRRTIYVCPFTTYQRLYFRRKIIISDVIIRSIIWIISLQARYYKANHKIFLVKGL